MNQTIENFKEGEKISEMVVGFDLVQEEDASPQLSEFIKEILEGKRTDTKNHMPCILHGK